MGRAGQGSAGWAVLCCGREGRCGLRVGVGHRAPPPLPPPPPSSPSPPLPSPSSPSPSSPPSLRAEGRSAFPAPVDACMFPSPLLQSSSPPPSSYCHAWPGLPCRRPRVGAACVRARVRAILTGLREDDLVDDNVAAVNLKLRVVVGAVGRVGVRANRDGGAMGRGGARRSGTRWCAAWGPRGARVHLALLGAACCQWQWAHWHACAALQSPGLKHWPSHPTLDHRPNRFAAEAPPPPAACTENAAAHLLTPRSHPHPHPPHPVLPRPNRSQPPKGMRTAARAPASWPRLPPQERHMHTPGARAPAHTHVRSPAAPCACAPPRPSPPPPQPWPAPAPASPSRTARGTRVCTPPQRSSAAGP